LEVLEIVEQTDLTRLTNVRVHLVEQENRTRLYDILTLVTPLHRLYHDHRGALCLRKQSHVAHHNDDRESGAHHNHDPCHIVTSTKKPTTTTLATLNVVPLTPALTNALKHHELS
jgi:hypothetical protein